MKRLLILLLFPLMMFAQDRKCGTMDLLNKIESENPAVKERRLQIEQDLQNRIGETVHKLDRNNIFDAFLKKYPHLKSNTEKLTKRYLYDIDSALYRQITRQY